MTLSDHRRALIARWPSRVTRQAPETAIPHLHISIGHYDCERASSEHTRVLTVLEREAVAVNGPF